MPSLAQLKQTWFIDTADDQPFPPQTRHRGSTVADHTDGNRLTAMNDLDSARHTKPRVKEALSIPDPPPPVGTSSVQVLHTYPLARWRGYSWSDEGEFTIWASYLNAIKAARTSIYIEDQYLYPYGSPPFIHSDTGTRRETDYVYQLGEALKRGVDVVALVPGRDNSFISKYQIQHRRRATAYLAGIANEHPGAGRFVVAKLHRGGDVVIHSKVMLVDDEFALIGNANICQRGIGYISELHLGMVDAETPFVRDLRLDLWQEHMELDRPDDIVDLRAGARLFGEVAERAEGRLHPYPTTRMRFELPIGWLMNNVIDPYKGPPRV